MANKRNARGSGMIRKRNDGRWEARYTVGRDPGTGKQIQKSIYGWSQEEVRLKLNEAIKAIDDGLYSDAGDMTVSRWMDIWINDYTLDIKDSTRHEYKDIIENHIKPRLGNAKLSKLSPIHIQQFYKKLLSDGRVKNEKDPRAKSKGLSAKTVRNIHTVLHAALDQATKPPHKLIVYNPTEGAVLPRVEKKEMKVLTNEEIKHFFEGTKGYWYYALFHTVPFCGLRRAEVLALELDRYLKSREDKRIDVVYQVDKTKTKDKSGPVLIPTKNDKVRSVYPCDAVFKVIDDYLKIREAMRLDAGDAWQESGLLFVNTRGGPVNYNVIYKSFKRYLQKAGIKDIRMHDLRHTFATISLASGSDIKTLQENLGHYDPGFTLKQYGHSTEDMRRIASDKLNEYYSRLEGKQDSTKSDESVTGENNTI